MLTKIKKDILKFASPTKAKNNEWFFKTGKGEYGYGDKFRGLTVPQMRLITAKYYNKLGFAEIKKLLKSKYHEERLIAILILVHRFKIGGPKEQKQIYNFYLAHTKYVNNWDLVDSSAPYIVGPYLLNRPRGILYRLAKSKSLWERRIAVVATFAFIKNDQFNDSLKIARMLLSDTHDLIHKAVGWMLRELGKKSERTLRRFLDKYKVVMPRTMLRYAIEKFPKKVRKQYLATA